METQTESPPIAGVALRPWRADEIPVEGWFREKADNTAVYRIASVFVPPDGGPCLTFADDPTELCYSMDDLAAEWEWAWNPFSPTFRGCGVAA